MSLTPTEAVEPILDQFIQLERNFLSEAQEKYSFEVRATLCYVQKIDNEVDEIKRKILKIILD